MFFVRVRGIDIKLLRIKIYFWVLFGSGYRGVINRYRVVEGGWGVRENVKWVDFYFNKEVGEDFCDCVVFK